MTSALGGWLLTYLLHSTVLILAAWVGSRVWRERPRRMEALWKAALVGPVVTASIHLAVILLQNPGAGQLRRRALAWALDPAGLPVLRLGAAWPGSPEIWSPGWTGLLVAVWALGAGWGAVAWLRRRDGIRRVLETGEPLTEGASWRRVQAGAARMGLNEIQVRLSSGLDAPGVVGRRVVVLPPDFPGRLPGPEEEAVLAHELAHLARRDPAWLTAGSLLAGVLWLQPLNRVALRGVRDTAELLADARAAEATGPGAMARALERLALEREETDLLASTAGLRGGGSPVVRRVESLLGGRSPKADGRPTGLLAVALVALALLVLPGAGFSISLKTGDGLPEEGVVSNTEDGARVVRTVRTRDGREEVEVRKIRRGPATR